MQPIRNDRFLWFLLRSLSLVVALAEMWLVRDFQFLHSIPASSDIGGPFLGVGTFFLLILSGAIVGRRKLLGLVSFVVSLVSLILAYAFLVQW